MNDNIREIWNQAASSHQQADTSRETQENFINRFAELIVRECSERLLHDAKLTDIQTTRCVASIKKHFGVE